MLWALTDTGYRNFGSNHIGRDLESDITGKQNSDSGTVLSRSHAEVLIDTSNLRRCDILPIEIIADRQFQLSE